MGQVTVYLEGELEAKMTTVARTRRLSKSEWIATIIREKLTSEWPHEIREAAGSWGDFPTIEEIRGSTHIGIDRKHL